jgi:hypothetical protein
MTDYTHLTFFEILPHLEKEVSSLQSGEVFQLLTTNDDMKAWVDLATIFHCKMLTPEKVQVGTLISFQKLHATKTFHKEEGIESKYGSNSTFATLNKLEQPAFLHYYLQALRNVTIEKRMIILNLGINSGDEFEVIKRVASNFASLKLVGVDYCESALQKAKERFQKDQNINFYCCDINNLEKLHLEKFDLIVSIGTLQSNSLAYKPLLMHLVQNYLKKEGAMILGFPNCRWIDGEMIYGAKAPHYSFSEMSLLYNDVIFAKKYLQQKKFRVTITGKEYIFLTATSIR